MKKEKIQDYLGQVLACHIALSPFDQNEFPFFVRKAFSFYSGELFNNKVFFLVAQTASTIKEIESTVFMFGEKVSPKAILVFENITRRERLSLVRRRISFIVPGTQMFLPYLGIDFSERIKEQRTQVSPKLRPIAQEILIEYLSDSLNPVQWPLSGLAEYMGYSPMGVLRAANQLEELKLCKVEYDGYRKNIRFDIDKKMLWKHARPYLQSPIKKTVSVENDSIFRQEQFPYAGEYALARYSNLAAARPCYAIYEKTYSDLLVKGKIHQSDSLGEGIADIQIWRYHTSRESEGDTVDLLSLELSFQDAADPRIKSALEQMKEQKVW
jgi:hypothetical protein